MALRYLLDTSIIWHLMRSPAGGVGRRIAEVGEDSICTSIIVAAALGDEKSRESLLRQAIDGFEAIGAPLQAARIRRSMGVDSTIDVTIAVRNIQEEATP